MTRYDYSLYTLWLFYDYGLIGPKARRDMGLMTMLESGGHAARLLGQAGHVTYRRARLCSDGSFVKTYLFSVMRGKHFCKLCRFPSVAGTASQQDNVV